MCTHAGAHAYTANSHRGWKPKQLQTETDTEDTAEEDCVGGQGKYSHGRVSLSHQHWVDQMKSAGSFRLHDTESAESYHKICMKRCSHRVKHHRQNKTQQSMMDYLCRTKLFDALKRFLPCQVTQTRLKQTGMQLRSPPLLPSCTNPNQLHPIVMGGNLANTRSQQLFLHPEIRVARVELMDLLCDKLGLPKSISSYRKLNSVEWNFGQHLVLQTGTAYWATDTQYTTWTSDHGRRRRDVLLLRGTEQLEQILPDGTRVLLRNAYCCEAVCFITVSNLVGLGGELSTRVLQDIVNGAFSQGVDTRPVTCGHVHFDMCTHAMLHVDTRTSTCRHTQFYMWTHAMLHVDTRTSTCGHTQFYMCTHAL